MKITTSKEAYDAIKGFIKYPEQEELFIICMTGRHDVKNIHFIGLGTDTAVCISTKVIAKRAILDMAGAVILVHTHPSGDPSPSSADIEQTGKCREALKLFDINLLDHIVIGEKKFYSFSEERITEVEPA